MADGWQCDEETSRTRNLDRWTQEHTTRTRMGPLRIRPGRAYVGQSPEEVDPGMGRFRVDPFALNSVITLLLAKAGSVKRCPGGRNHPDTSLLPTPGLCTHPPGTATSLLNHIDAISTEETIAYHLSYLSEAYI